MATVEEVLGEVERALLRALIEAARNEALEEAAKVGENAVVTHGSTCHSPSCIEDYQVAVRDAIHALKDRAGKP